MQRHSQKSPLLEVLNQRKAWDPQGPTPPGHKRYLDRKTREAARVHAQANAADPFSEKRICLYLRQGYVDPEEVLADANGLLKRYHGERHG